MIKVGVMESISLSRNCTLIVRGRTVGIIPISVVRVFAFQNAPMNVRKLCVSVPTVLFKEPKVATHNKQGGRVGISFPTDLEKYMSARPVYPEL